MNYPEWQNNAHEILELIPADAPIKKRTEYLVDGVAPHGQVFSVISFEELPDLEHPNFAVVDMYKLDPERNSADVGRAALGGAIAFVSHKENVTVMGLGWHNPKTPLGNGMVFVHELEHVTEAEEFDIYIPDDASDEEVTAISERRAYGTNKNIIRAVDGDAFDTYVNGLSYKLKKGRIVGNWKTILMGHPKPPIGSLMGDLHHEGYIGKRMLASIVIAASLDSISNDIREVNQTYGITQIV